MIPFRKGFNGFLPTNDSGQFSMEYGQMGNYTLHLYDHGIVPARLPIDALIWRNKRWKRGLDRLGALGRIWRIVPEIGNLPLFPKLAEESNTELIRKTFPSRWMAATMGGPRGGAQKKKKPGPPPPPLLVERNDPNSDGGFCKFLPKVELVKWEDFMHVWTLEGWMR